MLNHHQLSLPADVPADSLRPVTCIAFTEGPAVAADGTLYFADIIGNRILKLAPDGTRSVFSRAEPSHQRPDVRPRRATVALRRLGVRARRRPPRDARLDLRTGEYTIVTDRYDGARLQFAQRHLLRPSGPNVLHRSVLRRSSTMETDIEGVYRIDPDGRVTRILAQPVIERPNGLAVTADGQRLYVVDRRHVVGGNRKIWAFDLDEQGLPSNQRGLRFRSRSRWRRHRLDVEGTLYVAAGIMRPRGPHETADVPAGIYVISPDGQMRGRIPIPEDLVTNLAFGGPDGRTLYVTAGKTVFSVRMPVAGFIA